MLKIGKTYEYEFMSGGHSAVRFLVMEHDLGLYRIKFENGMDNYIQVDSPMAEFSEEIENGKSSQIS